MNQVSMKQTTIVLILCAIIVILCAAIAMMMVSNPSAKTNIEFTPTNNNTAANIVSSYSYYWCWKCDQRVKVNAGEYPSSYGCLNQAHVWDGDVCTYCGFYSKFHKGLCPNRPGNHMWTEVKGN
jgi:hypothetical protein